MLLLLVSECRWKTEIWLNLRYSKRNKKKNDTCTINKSQKLSYICIKIKGKPDLDSRSHESYGPIYKKEVDTNKDFLINYIIIHDFDVFDHYDIKIPIV